MGDVQNLVQEYQPTRRERVLRWLFPSRYCWGPEPAWEDLDQIRVQSVTVFSWADRLRILCTGCVYWEVRTATEHQVGRQETAVEMFPTVKILEPARGLVQRISI